MYVDGTYKLSPVDIDVKTPFIDLKFAMVYDLTEGNKKTLPQRSCLLKECLNSIDKIVSDLDNVLIEYQMSANDKSRCVYDQLVYHYCDKSIIVGPH